MKKKHISTTVHRNSAGQIHRRTGPACFDPVTGAERWYWYDIDITASVRPQNMILGIPSNYAEWDDEHKEMFKTMTQGSFDAFTRRNIICGEWNTIKMGEQK